MKVAHLLRKYHPQEWGGTETAVLRLLNGLRDCGVEGAVWCPTIATHGGADPFAAAGHPVRRFRAFLPVLRISDEQRRQLVSLGGNLMSLDLLRALWREPGLGAIHSHALNRLAGVGLFVARRRRLPFVVTIHGGALDLPATAREHLTRPLQGGFEWGKIFGLLLQSRRVLEKADAVLTCNPREAELLRAKYPRQRVIIQPHSVPTATYEPDHRAKARAAFPGIVGCDVLLTIARIDPVKNQEWLVAQAPAILQRFPNTRLVFVGASTHAAYEQSLRQTIATLGLGNHVIFTGGLAPGSAELVGLLQEAKALVLPSINETFGLVILEAWAAGTTVICSRTSGAQSLVRDRINGWLFDVDHSGQLLTAVSEALTQPATTRAYAEAGRQLARTEYDERVLAGRVRQLYDELAETKRNRR